MNPPFYCDSPEHRINLKINLITWFITTILPWGLWYTHYLPLRRIYFLCKSWQIETWFRVLHFAPLLLERSVDTEFPCFKTSNFFTISCYVAFDFNFSYTGRRALWGTRSYCYFSPPYVLQLANEISNDEIQGKKSYQEDQRV